MPKQENSTVNFYSITGNYLLNSPSIIRQPFSGSVVKIDNSPAISGFIDEKTQKLQLIGTLTDSEFTFSLVPVTIDKDNTIITLPAENNITLKFTNPFHLNSDQVLWNNGIYISQTSLIQQEGTANCDLTRISKRNLEKIINSQPNTNLAIIRRQLVLA